MKYRKKPVVVEVIKFDETKWEYEIANSRKSQTFPMVLLGLKKGFMCPVIDTFEGEMLVKDGDYIIEGVQGEFYPCKPDIFEAAYEEV